MIYHKLVEERGPEKGRGGGDGRGREGGVEGTGGAPRREERKSMEEGRKTKRRACRKQKEREEKTYILLLLLIIISTNKEYSIPRNGFGLKDISLSREVGSSIKKTTQNLQLSSNRS